MCSGIGGHLTQVLILKKRCALLDFLISLEQKLHGLKQKYTQLVGRSYNDLIQVHYELAICFCSPEMPLAGQSA